VHDDHVPLAALWNYRSEQGQLSAEEMSHLCTCDQCMSLLGLCQISATMKQVEERQLAQQSARKQKEELE
jgi:hypothetical protein